MTMRYKTAQVAKIIGIHPNTVRLYEEYGLITKPKRTPSGYRIYTDLHIEQFRLARAAMKVEVLQNGLRKQVIQILKSTAQGDFAQAIQLTKDYIARVQQEYANAEEALRLTKNLLAGIYEELPDVALTRRQAAQHLGLTIDTIRNWELNGLITITRMHNGYRVYTQKDLNRLKIIRSLRCANYSLSAILRMLNALSNDQKVDIREVINTPHPDEDIFRACDQLLTSLKNAEANARWMLQKLYEMEEKFAHGFNY